MLRIGNSALLSPYEALRLSLASPGCSFNALHDRFFGNGSLKFPRRIVLHLANRCNFACPMCSIGVARAERQKDFRGDSPWEVVEKTINEAGKHACYVELLGGEPTLYKNLSETIALLTKNHLPSYITTNGFNLKKRAAEMVEAGLKVMAISMDGWDEDSSYKRGLVPGSFDAIREGVQEVNRLRRGIFPIIRIATAVTKANYRNIDDIATAIYDMGIRRWTIQNYFFMTDGAMNAHHQMKSDTGVGDQVMAHHIPGVESYLDREEVAELRAALARTRKLVESKYKDMRVDFTWDLDLDAYYSPRKPAKTSSCAMPFNRIDVYPDGRIASCGDGHTIGNVLTGSIYEAWNGAARKKLMDLLARESVLPMCFRCCGIMNGLKFDRTSTPYAQTSAPYRGTSAPVADFVQIS